MKSNSLLLSMRPQHAKKLFDGTKRVELRRVAPRLNKGDILYVYVSSPVKQLHGKVEVADVVRKPLEELWTIVKDDAAITRPEFDEYFHGVKVGYAIFLRLPSCVKRPLPLDELRTLWNGFHPPRGFRFLSPVEVDLVTAALST